MLDYREFLKLPEIKAAFNNMYERQREYFKSGLLEQKGFDKHQLEAASIKMSVISTDLYFTEIHKKQSQTT